MLEVEQARERLERVVLPATYSIVVSTTASTDAVTPSTGKGDERGREGERRKKGEGEREEGRKEGRKGSKICYISLSFRRKDDSSLKAFIQEGCCFI